MGKRGQVSTFILVGLLVMIVIGLFFYFKEYVIKPHYLPEIEPLVLYTESCMKTTAADALAQASNQGGYVYLPEKITRNPESYVNLAFRVPYWYYQGENRMPSQKNIETQLSYYLTQNLNTCLKNFDAFKNKFSLNAETNISQSLSQLNVSQLQATVKLKDVVATLSVEIPLTVVVLQENLTTRFPRVETDVPHKLGSMYALAKAIMDHENKVAFLENYTDEMIASSDYLPYEGMELTCARREWTNDQLKDYIKNLVMYNFKYLMFENTNYQETNYPYYNKQYKVRVSRDDFTDLKVNTVYNPQWPMNVQVLPNKNGVVSPLHLDIPEALGQCLKIYHHKYSLDYPIVFQIINRDQPDQQLFFATPVLMRRNEPNRHAEVASWPEEIDVSASKDYCGNATSVTMYVQDAQGNLITRPTVASNLVYTTRVYAFDDTLPEPSNSLVGVNITYHCVKFKCDLGMTTYPTTADGLYTGGLAGLTTKFPPCQNGILIAEKEGYLPAKKSITTSSETENQQVTLKMTRIKPFTFGVKIIQDHNNIITERDLNENEQVLIRVQSKDRQDGQTNERRDTEEQWRVYPAQASAKSEPLNLFVGDYTYTLDIKLMRNENIYGGLVLNWTPLVSDVANKQYLEFLVFVKDPLMPPTTPQEFNRLWQYAIDVSSNYPPRLR